MAHLTDLTELAHRAFYWTSHSPDKRGNTAIKEHDEQLSEDLENIPESEHERYISNYRKYFSAWLSSHSNCASSAITGGSGFNVRRAEKANNAERNKYNAFNEWREKALKAIKRNAEKAKPENEKNAENWGRLQSDILHSSAVIHGINNGTERGCSKALFVSSIYQKVETYARHGNIEIVEAALSEIRRFNKNMSVVITERHKFFKLAELAESIKAKQETNKDRENTEITIPGGHIVQNWEAERIQFFFDGKPDREVIDLMKRKAFKWAPSVGAWQRQNTNNALYAVREIREFLQNRIK